MPVTPDKLDDVAALTSAMAKFTVVVDHPAQVDALLAHAPPPPSASGAPSPWHVMLMVDSGYHRDGVDPEGELALELARRLHESPDVEFGGVYTHGGHSYDVEGREAISAISAAERDAVVALAKRLRDAGIPCSDVGVGSTPTCSRPPTDGRGLEGVTEMHPGNYIFYDTAQLAVGSCDTVDDVAVRIATRVVGHYPPSTLLIDMGWTAQGGGQGKEAHYGEFTNAPDLRVRQLKQEAGEVESRDGGAIDFSKYPVGSVLMFAPYHSCAAGHCHQTLKVMADGKLVGELEVAKGW